MFFYANDSSTTCDVNNIQEIKEEFALEFCGACEDELCKASVQSEKSKAVLFMSVSFAAFIMLQ